MFKTLDDIEVSGKKVLLRVDYNEPIDHKNKKLLSTNRIVQEISTIKELMDKQAKVIIVTHQGSDIEYHNFYSTYPHFEVLSSLLGDGIKYIPDICGPFAIESIRTMKNGEVLLLENIRYLSEEQTLFEKSVDLSFEEMLDTLFIKRLDPYIDIFVNDAFSASHRKQPSICAFPLTKPSVIGRLFEKEIRQIDALTKIKSKGTIYLLGGSKIDDALDIIRKVLNEGLCDKVLTGGLVANLFLLAAGKKLGLKSEKVLNNKGFLARLEEVKDTYNQYYDKIILPEDLAFVRDDKRQENDVCCLQNEVFVDIGAKTIEKYTDLIMHSKKIFVNGPVGVFESHQSELGTKKIWEALSKTSAETIIGGGDSITVTEKYHLQKHMDYLCTGGGALIQYLSGKKLPAICTLLGEEYA